MSLENKYTHRFGAVFKDGDFLGLGSLEVTDELNQLQGALEEHHGNLLGVAAERDAARKEVAELREDKARLVEAIILAHQCADGKEITWREVTVRILNAAIAAQKA